MPKRARRCSPTQYATERTDAPGDASAPLITVTSPKGGRPTDIDLRAIVNTRHSKRGAACQWRLLPADVPPMSSVRSAFDPWNRDGTCIKINDTLRQLARHALDRDPEPSISVLDSHIQVLSQCSEAALSETFVFDHALAHMNRLYQGSS